MKRQSSTGYRYQGDQLAVWVNPIKPVLVFLLDRVNRQAGLVILIILLAAISSARAAERKKISVRSTFDKSLQPSYLILPTRYDAAGSPIPLLVSLHTWSGDLEQRNTALEKAADSKGWIYLFPNFRGVNRTPQACGSPAACQDILDAVKWVQARYRVDQRRIYLTGVSGGGHMTMLMVGKHPQPWAAASAWVGISDLRTWHDRHAEGKYGQMLRQCCGGKPMTNAEVDRQYRQRSPITWLHRSLPVPLDMAAGIHDGHTGSVPIRHSLKAFNLVARAAGEMPITEQEMAQLGRRNGRLDKPRSSDRVKDPILGKEIYLRRMAGKSRVTIFEGGHEGNAAAAVNWLERHTKDD